MEALELLVLEVLEVLLVLEALEVLELLVLEVPLVPCPSGLANGSLSHHTASAGGVGGACTAGPRGARAGGAGAAVPGGAASGVSGAGGGATARVAGAASPGGARTEGTGAGGGGAAAGGAGAAGPGGARTGGTGAAGAGGTVNTGGVGGAGTAGLGGAHLGGSRGALSPQQLREWYTQHCHLWCGAAGAGGTATGDAGAGGTGAAEAGGAANTRAVGAGAGHPGAGGAGVGGAGAGFFGAAGGFGATGTSTGGVGAGGAGAGGTAQPACPYVVSSCVLSYCGPNPESNLVCATSPTVTRLFATIVIGPSLESVVASALVVEVVDFAVACRLDYAASLVTESESVCPPSIGGECALGTDILQDRKEHFDCLAATVPHLVAMLLAPDGDPDAPDIPTPRSYAEAIAGEYSSQWQTAMDAEIAS
ncbi:unnamed protein product [Closterium sp. NIES-65]|nr:unnamed protein product [Closterium sp. NIES-65]